MAIAKMSLIGLYDYTDGSCFDSLTLPEGISKDTFIQSLLLKYGEFGLIYINPDTLTGMVKAWGLRHYRTFEKWIAALNIDYEPLYNYDRTEEEEAGKESETTGTDDHSYTDTNTGSYSTDVTPNNRASTTSRSAYNSSTLEDVVKVNETGSTTTTVNYSDAPTLTHSQENDRSEQNKESSTRKLRAYGNIGVTTSQNMLRSELDISLWNLYDHMSDLFADDFLIRVYDL